MFEKILDARKKAINKPINKPSIMPVKVKNKKGNLLLDAFDCVQIIFYKFRFITIQKCNTITSVYLAKIIEAICFIVPFFFSSLFNKILFITFNASDPKRYKGILNELTLPKSSERS